MSDDKPNTDVGQVLAEIVAELRAIKDGAVLSSRRWLSIEEAAEHARLSPRSIRSLLASGRLGDHRVVAGRCLIDRQELDGLIASGRTHHLRRGWARTKKEAPRS